MRCRPEMMRLYAVTDRTWTKKKSLIEQVEAAICGGATCIQLREKNLDEEAFCGRRWRCKSCVRPIRFR